MKWYKNSDFWVVFFVSYLLCGALTLTAMGLSGAFDAYPDSYSIPMGVVIFWPLFVIKYAAIAIWAVLSSTAAFLF